MRESKDITREELINMVGKLRGMLYSYFDDLTMEEIKDLNEDRLRVLSETAFGQSDCEGDVKTASERIAELEEKLAAANAFIEANKDVISEKAAKTFIQATRAICENVDKLGKQMVDIIKRACDDCPHRQVVPCETCKLEEERAEEIAVVEKRAPCKFYSVGSCPSEAERVKCVGCLDYRSDDIEKLVRRGWLGKDPEDRNG